jgi:acyl dehydratase
VSDVDWSAPFEALTPGQAFVTRGRTITEADIVGFASLTGDWHPQHADAGWAAASRFGERIAHGLLIVSYAVGLVPFDPDRVVALRRIADVVFKRPVTIGETIRVEGRLVELSPLGEEDGLVAWSWSVRSEQALVCRARVEVLWRRNAAPTMRAGARVADLDLIDYPSGVLPC